MQGKLTALVCYSIGLINVLLQAFVFTTDVYANPTSASQDLEGGRATLSCSRRDETVAGTVTLRAFVGRI